MYQFISKNEKIVCKYDNIFACWNSRFQHSRLYARLVQCTNLCIDDPDDEEKDEDDRGGPPASRVRGPLVQHQLVRLQNKR